MYTRQQMLKLLASVDSLDLVESHDFSYDLDNPVELDDASEDVVLVLRRT